MGKHRAFLPFLQRRQTRRLVDYQERARTAYGLYETRWADAWPHLDDWFKTEALLSQRNGNGPIIV